MRRMLAAMSLYLAPLAGFAADQSLPPLGDAPAEFARRAATAADARCIADDPIALAVDLSAGEPIEASYDTASGHLHVRYRMSFNQITEGWNWHPESAVAGGDYYEFKYLPLGATFEKRGSHPSFNDGKFGAPPEYRVEWRYDYYFAFDNPYDFFARSDDADMGFAADVALPAAEGERLIHGGLRMALRGKLGKNCLADSTTYFRATPDRPVDFTVKKRYLIGKLTEVDFWDSASGRILARLHPSLAH